MKNKIKYLGIIIITFILTILLLNTKSFAGTQKLNNLKYEVQLNEDGTADIIENWDISVTDTNTLFRTFDVDSTKYGRITNVNVMEVTDGMRRNFIDTNMYEYHVTKGGFYALNTSENEFEIAWGVSIEGTENRLYQISYTITDAIKTFNDCSEFYWQFISEKNGISASKVEGIIKLPSKVIDRENLKVWAHGPLNGIIEIVDNKTVSFEVNKLSTETMVEVRIITLEDIFARKLK